MYIGSDVMVGIAVLLMCLLMECIILGVIIISLLAGIKVALIKFLKLYTALSSKK